MIPKKIKSIEELKQLANLTFIDCFILLAGCVRSFKRIHYDKDVKLFYIHNEMDDTHQELTEEKLNDEKYSMIKQAIDKGVFFVELKEVKFQ